MLFTSLLFPLRWPDKITFQKGCGGGGNELVKLSFYFFKVYNKVKWTFWYFIHNFTMSIMSMAIQFYLAWKPIKDKQESVMLILGWDVSPAKCVQTTPNCGYTLRSSECCLFIKTTYVWHYEGQRFCMLLLLFTVSVRNNHFLNKQLF